MKKKFIFIISLLTMILVMGMASSAHEQLQDATLEITVTATNGGRVYRGDDNWSALTGLELSRGTEITLEAIENKGKFVYWKDEISNKIISDDPTYTFTLIKDMNITAFFLPDNYLASYGYVTFADINGRIFRSNYVADGAAANEPDVSWVENPGYTLVGWDSDEWKNVSAGEILLIRTEYEKKEVSYELSVTGGSSDPLLSEYEYDELVTIVADAALIPQDKVFAGWNVNGEKVAYSKIFGIRMGCNVEAEAVYAEEECENLPLVAVIDVDTEVYSNGVSILMMRNIPEEYEVVESGMLMAYGTSEDALTIDSASVTVAKALDNSHRGMYRYNKNLGTGATLRVVPYVIYKTDDTLYITYGTEKRITR
ncbi:MAG: hypothetical protein IKL74_00590 [Clostridia bacterium]|nr:hypothetical protein [Clostridia bacterium]